jgi:hypothetical protein
MQMLVNCIVVHILVHNNNDNNKHAYADQLNVFTHSKIRFITLLCYLFIVNLLY